MELAKVHITVTISATFIGVLFILLNYLFSYQSGLWLTIEVMIVPAIYIIGNIYAEKLITRKFVTVLYLMAQETAELDEKYYKLVMLNERLRNKLRNQYGKEKK